MTALPGHADLRWARCAEVLSCQTGSGTVLLPPGGGAALSLSSTEQAIWELTVEPTRVDDLPTTGDGQPLGEALSRLCGLGVIHEVS